MNGTPADRNLTDIWTRGTSSTKWSPLQPVFPKNESFGGLSGNLQCGGGQSAQWPSTATHWRPFVSWGTTRSEVCGESPPPRLRQPFTVVVFHCAVWRHPMHIPVNFLNFVPIDFLCRRQKWPRPSRHGTRRTIASWSIVVAGYKAKRPHLTGRPFCFLGRW